MRARWRAAFSRELAIRLPHEQAQCLRGSCHELRARARRPLALRLLVRERMLRDRLHAVGGPPQPHQLRQQQHELVEELSDAH
jgi:hypothetical protein